MTNKRTFLWKSCFVLLLTLSLLLFIYISNIVPFFKANLNGQETQGQEEIVFEIPSIEDLDKLNHRELAELYHRYINRAQVLCSRIVRIGKLGDGGWEVCEDKLYKPKPPCLVFSFGIGNDFSFDDHMAERYGCEIHSFDPSMDTPDGLRGKQKWFHPLGLDGTNEELLETGWTMKTFDEILKVLNYTKKTTIDVLKVDIEESEWQAGPQMVQTGVLNSVHQLIMEIHISIGPEPMREKYFYGLALLKSLYNQGFRIYFTHRNLWCSFLSKFEGIDEVGCHEVGFIKLFS